MPIRLAPNSGWLRFQAVLQERLWRRLLHRLGTPSALNDVELDFIAFFPCLVSVHLNCGIVDKYIRPVPTPDESVIFDVIEPLNPSFELRDTCLAFLHTLRSASGHSRCDAPILDVGANPQ